MLTALFYMTLLIYYTSPDLDSFILSWWVLHGDMHKDFPW